MYLWEESCPSGGYPVPLGGIMSLWEVSCTSGRYHVSLGGIMSFWGVACLSLLIHSSTVLHSSSGNCYHAWFAVDRKTQTEPIMTAITEEPKCKLDLITFVEFS